MEVQPDFKELLKLLNAHKAEFIIVGAYALAFHGVPRFTGDMDILVKPDSKNASEPSFRWCRIVGLSGAGP